jgi:pimeloyl-ACP methyl ester carboxylesterase
MDEHELHYLAGWPDSYALISQEDTDTLAVFVHGFWGDATRTWSDFPRLVDDKRESFEALNKSDFVFINYPSLQWPIEVAAHRIGGLILRLYPESPADVFDPMAEGRAALGVSSSVLMPRTLPFSYKRLVLVGHSGGAVVIRGSC